MKSELLALATANLANATANLGVAQSLLDGITALPDDPLSVPTGFRISRTYGDNVDSPIAAEFSWDDAPAGVTSLLEYKGAPSNPNGPDEWTAISLNGAPGPNGERATYIVEQRTQQIILFRLRFTNGGQFSEPATLQFSTPENLPVAFA